MKLRKKLALMLANLRKKRPYYCEVEYLESTGTQYIDTGYAFQDDFSWEVNFKGIPNNTTLFGGRSSSNRTALLYQRVEGTITTTCPIAGYNGASTPFQLANLNDGNRHKVKMAVASNKGSVWVDGSQVYNKQAFTGTYISGITQAIFADKFGTNDYREQTSSKVYGLKMWQGLTLVRDYIPVLDWEYIPCMYDKVSGQFFYNIGTGTFSYGREIHYVDYIESDGTQYISSGIYLTNNYSVEIDYQLTVASQSRKGIYGGLVANGSRHGALLSPSNQYLEAGYGAGNDYYQIGYPDTNRHVLKQEKNKLYFDGNLVYTFNTATFTQNFIAPLGNFNYTNYNPASAKYYRSKWWDNDTLVRDYKPATDENGVGFMFDTVSHTIFDNAGTGAFKYPAVECEYLEVTSLGTANNRPCIDLGIKYKSSMSIEGKYTRTAQGDSGSVLPLSTNTINPVLYFPALNATATVDRFVWRRASLPEANYFYSFSNYPLTVDFKLDAVNDALYVNGSKVKTGMIASMNGYSSPYVSSSNLYMLSITGNYGGMGKVYYLKLYDTTQVYRDLVPAWKDGSFGMYDKENNTLYTVSGSGTVVLGKIIESEWE